MNNIKKYLYNILKDTKDYTNYFSKKDIKDGKLISLLCYLNIFTFVPYFISDNKYVLFHAKEGINLFCYEIIIIVIIRITELLISIIIAKILSFGFRILFILLSFIGIKNILTNKARELPLVNYYKLSKYL